MEIINRVPTRMRDRLTAILADMTAPKEHQKFAAKVLQYYGEKDADPNEDPEVRRMLAETFSEMLWTGQSSLVEENGELIYRHQTANSDAPEYRRRDYDAPLTKAPVPVIKPADEPIEYDF